MKIFKQNKKYAKIINKMVRQKKEEEIRNILDERKKLKKAYLILLVVSAALLFLSGLFILIFSGSILNKLNENVESPVLTEMNIVILSSAWLFMSYFISLSIYKMNQKLTRNWINLLLFFSIIIIFTGNLISGLLSFVISVILLTEDIKLEKKIS